MCKNENTDSGILRGSFICYTWQLNSRAKENLFPLENVLSWVDEVCEKVLFPVPQPTSATVATLFKGEGNLLDDGFCVFAFGFAQNDRVGSILRRVKVLGIEKLIIERNQPYRETKHTNQKGNWCYV